MGDSRQFARRTPLQKFSPLIFTTMTIDLSTAVRLNRNWSELTEEQIATLEADKVIKKEIEHNTNLTGRGQHYTGQVQARAVWVHVATGEVIAEASPWASCAVEPNDVYRTLGTGMAISQEAQVLLVTVNGGQMPNLLPPVEPVVEPEPITEPVDADDQPNG